MSDADEPPAPARPTTPRLSARPSSSARPARPRRATTAEPAPEAVERPPAPPEPVIAETVVIAPPPPEPAPPAPPRGPGFGSPFLRQTLVPPCLVLSAGCLGLGIAYFCLPADAVSKQMGPGLPMTLLLLGGVCGGLAWTLGRSTGRIDSLPPNS